jgi:hypothetical protein
MSVDLVQFRLVRWRDRSQFQKVVRCQKNLSCEQGCEDAMGGREVLGGYTTNVRIDIRREITDRKSERCWWSALVSYMVQSGNGLTDP